MGTSSKGLFLMYLCLRGEMTDWQGKPSLVVLIPRSLPYSRVVNFVFPEGPSSLGIPALLGSHAVQTSGDFCQGPSSTYAGRKAETRERKGAGQTCLCTHFGHDVPRSWNACTEGPSPWLQAIVGDQGLA